MVVDEFRLVPLEIQADPTNCGKSRRITWVPYYAASGAAELTCENYSMNAADTSSQLYVIYDHLKYDEPWNEPIFCIQDFPSSFLDGNEAETTFRIICEKMPESTALPTTRPTEPPTTLPTRPTMPPTTMPFSVHTECPGELIWNECGHECNDIYCCPGTECDMPFCTEECQARCECPSGTYENRFGLCVSTSDESLCPVVQECPIGCIEEDKCERPSNTECGPNEHWVKCDYCTENDCKYGMACAKRCENDWSECCVIENQCVCDAGYARYTGANHR